MLTRPSDTPTPAVELEDLAAQVRRRRPVHCELFYEQKSEVVAPRQQYH